MDANTIRSKLAALEQQASILRQALKIMEDGGESAAHGNGRPHRPQRAGIPKQEGLTVAGMAESALVALREDSFPKQIAAYIMDAYKQPVNPGTLGNILWRSDQEKGTFKKGRKAGTYGLRAWVAEGKPGHAPGDQSGASTGN